MNVYLGCEMGCPYCDGWVYSSRPLNETVRVPLNLPQLLAEELQTVSRGDLIAITALSDPYQPAEQSYRITRQVLQLMADVGQPCLILTKGRGILEDIPLLQRINEQSLAIVMTTLLTMDRYTAERLESKSPAPALRLEMLAALKRAGIPVGVAMVPIIPYVNDTNTVSRALFRACAEVGVDFVIWDYLHVPNERHRMRVDEMLIRVAAYPNSFYRDVFQGQSLPNANYRAERDAEMLVRCDGFGLDPRAPHRLFAGRLDPKNEAALLLKHTAFRDTVNGRVHMDALHRDLAERVYGGEIRADQLRLSPLWPTLKQIFKLKEDADH
jgi:DNA repair photolyase